MGGARARAKEEEMYISPLILFFQEEDFDHMRAVTFAGRFHASRVISLM